MYEFRARNRVFHVHYRAIHTVHFQFKQVGIGIKRPSIIKVQVTEHRILSSDALILRIGIHTSLQECAEVS